MKAVATFQGQFRSWMGPDPYGAAVVVAQRSGYTVDYVRWAAGLIGKRQWPGSRKFVRAMADLGCTTKPWRDRSPEELARALRHREVLHDPLHRMEETE